MHAPSVLISILNWNNSADTLACVDSLGAETRDDTVRAEVRIIDNGSGADDYQALERGAQQRGIAVTRLENNLGFTGGHNTSIRIAIDKGFDYIWLLNNDATVAPGCLKRLVAAMEAEQDLGAVSPVIEPEGGGDPVAAWGGVHEWKTRSTVWFASKEASLAAHAQRPQEIFVAGTAALLRTAALAQTGGLDDRLFAYYDDSDIGVRLASKGWRSKVVFDAAVEHGWRTLDQLPKHVFYLMYRNEMIFWQTHMPAEYRGLLRFKLVNQAIYNAIRLSMRGMQWQADAALLGIWDFMFHHHGRPDLERKVPGLLRLGCRLSEFMHKSRLREFRAALPSNSH